MHPLPRCPGRAEGPELATSDAGDASRVCPRAAEVALALRDVQEPGQADPRATRRNDGKRHRLERSAADNVSG